MEGVKVFAKSAEEEVYAHMVGVKVYVKPAVLRTATYIVDMLFFLGFTTLFLSFWAFYFYSPRVNFLAHINYIYFDTRLVAPPL